MIYLTEDASSPNGLIYRWTPPAAALPLGRGALTGLADDAGVLEAMQIAGQSEFTGPTFSHDKKILFANVQSPGHIFAIRGPFRRQ